MKGVYIMGGYPSRERFIECCESAIAAGFDFIEAGVPFNDPVADGPVISEAGAKSIAGGTTLSMVMDDLLSFKAIPVKKYVMTYANIIHAFGPANFSVEYGGLLDGVIVADLPNRMASVMKQLQLSVPMVPFATLETRERDLDLINSSTSDIVYFVGLRGITGSAADLNSDEIKAKISMLKAGTSKKIVTGFGIKTRSDAETALSLGHGFVVGTAAVQLQHDIDAYRSYLASLV